MTKNKLTFASILAVTFISAHCLAQSAVTIPFDNLSVDKSVLPTNPPEPLPGSTHAMISISNITVAPGLIEGLNLHINQVDNLIIDQLNISLRTDAGHVVSIGTATQTQVLSPYENLYTIPAASTQLTLTYSASQKAGLCPNRHDGILPHPCTEGREEFHLKNASGTLDLGCVEYSEVVSPTDHLDFAKADSSGLPSCE